MDRNKTEILSQDDNGIQDFLKDNLKNEKTIHQYECQINQFIRQGPDLKDDRKLQEHIVKFIFSRNNSGEVNRCYLRRYALKYYLLYLNKLYLYEELVKKNKGRLKQPARRQLKKTLPFQHIRLLIKNLRQPYRLISMLQYDAALRIGAVLNITTDDIDDDYNSLTVKEKGNQLRTVYVSRNTRTLLLQQAKAAGTGKLFDVKYKKVWTVLKELALQLLNINLSTHWFRSSRAVHLLQVGENIETVRELLGHSNIQMTHIYVQEAGVTSKALMKRQSPMW